MQTTFWSRRRFVAAVAATVAVASTPSVFVPRARAAEGTAPGGSLELPDTERAKAVHAWVLGGRAVKAAAAHALSGTDTQIAAFLTDELPKATIEDNRVAVLTYLANAGTGMRRDATEALNAGDSAIAAFVKNGFAPAVSEDLRFGALSLTATGGQAVKRDTNAAVNAGTQKALEDFLLKGQYDARLEDMRVEITASLVTAGPEVKKYANRALSGTAEDVQWYLDTGQHIARARDQETATIEDLVAVVEREGKRAQAKTDLAVEASERAKTAADKAKEAAEKAAAEAEKAKDDVQRSGNAARKAASAAKGAAGAARIAIGASNAAIEASRRASWASTAASQAAASAGSAASRAYNAAIAASKDASKASAAKDAAVAARNAASRARTAAKAADQAAVASQQAAGAGSAAASAARNAAAAANASAQAATAAGKAQSEAAEARRQASIAANAANRATNAASTAQALAGTAASAARTARDAANSAAGHADKAADAAEEAVKYAGKALDYANKSTAHANEAVKAANTATKTVAEAVEVAKKAREAEMTNLEEDKKQGIQEARELALIDAEDQAAHQSKRLQAQQTSQALKDLIGKAEAALASGDLTAAATLGRQAAVGLLPSTGTWTREAAQFALAGSDDDVLTWIDLDRAIAQAQDDRETILFIAQIAEPAVAESAAKMLEVGTTQAIGDWDTSGVIKAGEEENRVRIFRILNSKPGKAVRNAANTALNANTPEALQKFFDTELAKAVKEDDAVTTATIVASAGPYSRAYGEVALEGPAWMRRHFVDVVQHQAAQLDHDSLSHAAAISAAIAAANKIAHEAQRDAAKASQAAAEARNAATDAANWAKAALDSAALADGYAQDARDNADAADKSAADAKASADKASAAAATARGAARAANYSANRALDAARSAAGSASSARASAASARNSAIAAGQDAAVAAAAASDARRIAADKRRAEIAEAARKAAVQAKKDKENKNNPSDSSTHDRVNPRGSESGEENWWEDAGWWADAFGTLSTASGLASLGFLGACVFFPATPILGTIAGVLGAVSIGASGLSVLFTGIEYGFSSSQFVETSGGAALGLVTRGAGRLIGQAPKVVAPVVRKVSEVADDVSTVVKELSPF